MHSSPRLLSFPGASSRLSGSFGQSAPSGFDPLLGSSSAITTLRAQILRVAPYARTVCLSGAPGCGDVAAARAIHERSQLNETALQVLSAPDAEAFFASGDAANPPSPSAIYLPEFTAFTRPAQLNLVRRMRSRSGQPLLLIAFCAPELRSLVAAGTLLPELAGSLGAVRLKLPSLAERREDIPQLTEQLLQQLALATGTPAPHLSEDFLQNACKYIWPGNLPQMESVLGLLHKRAAISLSGDDLRVALEQQATHEPTAESTTQARMVRLELIVQEHIRSVLLGCGGNKLRAAEVLGISRSTLYRMLDASTPMQLPVAS